ncbi:MAG: insulinase family protein [Firmicutes bacterium]|nr:insulinase family protein [Bacillota bacterium]
MKKGFKMAVLITAILLVCACALQASELKLNVKKHTLPNGLTVLIVEKHDAPIVALYRYHKVGAVNEYANMFGCSHLLEHMMFKGTDKIGTWNYKAEQPYMKQIEKLVNEIDKERVKGLSGYHTMDKAKIDKLWKQVADLQAKQSKYMVKNEIHTIYDEAGGRGLNASTGFDATDYYLLLPSNKLELWAFVEADRMGHPVFREFYSERDVVYEERRMRTDNDPDGVMFENFFSHFFVAIPYGQDVVGWASDLESMRKDKVMAYLRKYYSPGNTTLAIVGDVTEKEALAMVTKYFGPIPAQPLPEPIFSEEPTQAGERRIEVKFDANPQMMIGFHGPRPGTKDQYALDMISYILSHGRTSRFYQDLVKKNIAYSVSGGNWTLGYTNAFIIQALPKGKTTDAQLEKAIYAELDKLKTEPVTQQELDKVHNRIDLNYVRLLDNPMAIAQSIAQAQAWTGDWQNLDDREKLKKVTPEDIMQVAKKYFTEDNRTIVTLVKKETPAAK